MARNGRPVQAEAFREVFLLLWRLQEGLSEGPAAVKVSEPQKSHFESQQKAGWYRPFWSLWTSSRVGRILLFFSVFIPQHSLEISFRISLNTSTFKFFLTISVLPVSVRMCVIWMPLHFFCKCRNCVLQITLVMPPEDSSFSCVISQTRLEGIYLCYQNILQNRLGNFYMQQNTGL